MTIRRLAAVLIADITGYSRLMHEDEDGTHARVSRIMREVAGPAAACDLADLLEAPLGGAEVAALKPQVCIDHSD